MRHRNKILSALLVCLLLMQSMCFAPHLAAFAEGDSPAFVLGSGSAAPGETVEIPVTITNNPGIVGLCVSVSYDRDVLTLQSAQSVDLFGGGMYTFGNDLTLNPYNLIWEDGLSRSNYTQSGVFAVLTFKVSEDAPAGESPVTIRCVNGSIFDTNLDEVSFAAVSGAVTVTAPDEGGWSFDPDTDLHIHETANGVQFVAGLNPDDPYVSDYVVTTGGWSFTVELNDQNCESTGAMLTIYNADGDVVDVYEIVLFGDVDGNSVVDGVDAMLIKDAVNLMGQMEWMRYNETDDYVYTYAADVDHSYVLDGQDVMALSDGYNFFKPCNQNWAVDGDPIYQ